MKKIFCYLVCFTTILILSITAQSANFSKTFYKYYFDGLAQESIDVFVTGFELSDGKRENLLIEIDETGETVDHYENLLPLIEGEDAVVIFKFKTDNEVTPYPNINEINIRICAEELVGGRSPKLGKNYRIYYIENEEVNEIEISSFSDTELEFKADELGVYVFCYDPRAYSVPFYENEIERNENYEIINEEYYRCDNLDKYDAVIFSEMPKKDGYIFTGWKQNEQKGAYYSKKYVEYSETSFDKWKLYSSDWRVYAFDARELYASWCPEEEYTPLEVTLEYDEKITKGKENGREITLKLSEGKFNQALFESGDIPLTIEDAYKKWDFDDYFSGWGLENWKFYWNVVGSDEILIDTVELIDETTLKFTLSGNSSDKYKDSEIWIEFNSSLYISCETDETANSIYETADIQLDENGIKKAMFISDNSIKLNRQKKSSGSSSVYYSVSFDSNGGENVKSKRVKRGNKVLEPETPLKDGYVFQGWYEDEELTEKYDFERSVTKEITLYAAWEEDDTNKIVLTVGEVKATIYGEEVTNDVAPVIRNDRVMLPLRFVLESLGAEVIWKSESPDEVKITKDGTEILIYIGKNEAYVNGEKVMLDSPAFLENDRTYIPIRFVAESLDCDVMWNEEDKQVVITTR